MLVDSQKFPARARSPPGSFPEEERQFSPSPLNRPERSGRDVSSRILTSLGHEHATVKVADSLGIPFPPSLSLSLSLSASVTRDPKKNSRKFHFTLFIHPVPLTHQASSSLAIVPSVRFCQAVLSKAERERGKRDSRCFRIRMDRILPRYRR